MDLDLTATEQEMATMFERIVALAQEQARIEPLRSLEAEDHQQSDRMRERLEQLIASGKGVVQEFVAAADRCGIDVAGLHSCCELGCGAGRSAVWLADLFGQVLGYDVSPQHLDFARRVFNQRGIGNVTLQLIRGLDSIRGLPGCDAFFSIDVLQYFPPPIIVFVLRQMLDKLNRGGAGYFQVPTYILGYSFHTADFLLEEPVTERPKMHALPQDRLWGMVADCGCELLEIRDVGTPGVNAVSNRILVRKK